MRPALLRVQLRQRLPIVRGMMFEPDPNIRTLTQAVKLLSDIATHQLTVHSDYPDLRIMAESADRLLPDVVAVIGNLKKGRAPKRADD